MSTYVRLVCACGIERSHNCPLPWGEPMLLATPDNGAWHSVWLHGNWRSLTREMTTPEREHAADAVARYSQYLAWCDGEPDRPEPEGLCWWRDDEVGSPP